MIVLLQQSILMVLMPQVLVALWCLDCNWKQHDCVSWNNFNGRKEKVFVKKFLN